MMRLELLGYPHVTEGDTRSPLPHTKPAYLLLYLACRTDWVSRDELALFFRPDADEKTAKKSLRLLLTRARKLPWAAGLELEGDRLRFLPETDLAEFRAALGKADWASVTKLYRGAFLEAMPGLGLTSLEAWLDVERAALASSWQAAASKYAEQLKDEHRYTEAESLYQRMLMQDPLAEDTLQAYLRAAYLAGNAQAALTRFEAFKTQLQADLDLTPLPETVQLARTLARSGDMPEPKRPKATSVPLTVLHPPVLVGRDHDYALLTAPDVQLAFVAGEAGVGKSRLLRAALPDGLWLRCRDGLSHIAYYPLVECLRALPELPDVGSYRVDLARLLPELAESGIALPEGELASARLLEALARVFEAQGQALIFDDVQWIDPATLEFFVFMAHRRQLSLFAAYRLAERSPALHKVLSSLEPLADVSVALAPLTLSAITDLLASLAPQTKEASMFAEWLCQKSGGNPFYLLETLRALFEAEVLSADNTAWYSSLDALSRSYAELQVPPGVASLVRRRVEGLSAEAKRVLDAASVMVEGFSAELLASLTGLSVWATSEALVDLEARGLVAGDAFAHDLTREALYAAIPDAHRLFLHRHIARQLETQERQELLAAEHYYRAGRLAETARLWFHAARFGYSAGNFEAEARALYERIIELDIDTEDVYRAKAYLSGHYFNDNDLEKMKAGIADVLAKSHDTLARTQALLYKVMGHFLAGEMSEAETTIEQAERYVIDFDDPGIQSDVMLARVQVDYYQGRYDQALELAENALQAAEARGPSAGLISWTGVNAMLLCALGRFEEALDHYYTMLATAKQLGFKRRQVSASSDIMATLYDLGRLQEGIELGEAALELGEFDVTFPLRFHLALAYFQQGRFADALAQANAVLDGDSSLNIRGHTYALLAELYSVQQDEVRASDMIETGLELIETSELTDAKAVMTIATLKFGSDAQAKRARPLVTELSGRELAAYVQQDFRDAVALGRHL